MASDKSENDLDEGIYEELVTEAIRSRVEELVRTSAARTQFVHAAEQARVLGAHVGRVAAEALRHVDDAKRLAAANRLLAAIADLLPPERRGPAGPLAPGPSLLLEVNSDPSGESALRPILPFLSTELLVNARGEPQLAREIAAEIASAGSIDLLVAFLKWSGVVLVRDALQSARARGVPVRILTTTYLGATERRAVDELVRMGAEIRISYEVLRTRLHAKAWLFRRHRQLDTAYVGSSNLSRAAMTDGLEWNVRLSRHENAGVLDKFAATFDTYWNGGDFEGYDPAIDGDRLDSALAQAGSTRPAAVSGVGPIVIADLDVRAYPFQQEILDRLEAERSIHERWRNLVVAATGTGKTVVAALDYARLASRWPRFQLQPRLLFVAHRSEILHQSLATFRTVLRDPTFGELFVGGKYPSEWRHVFASIQSLTHLNVDAMAPDQFDVVIVDEFHHAEAPTYQRLLGHLRPSLLLGLTATPERADGLDIRRWFDGHTATELRLWEALERDLLCPFHYFAAYDGVDVASLEWKRGGYDTGALDRLYTGNHARAAVVLRQLADKVADPHRMRALGFCVSVAHAEFMARVTSETGLNAVALSGGSTAEERSEALRRLRDGTLQIIYSVDLFNEGLDIPEVDTVVLLRPTESATVFLQQLGRGLRHAESKSHLTVLDFVGHQHRQFRFDLRFQALTGQPRARLVDAAEQGFPFLPSGCFIHLDSVAAQVVIENLRSQIRSDAKALAGDLILAGDVDLAEFLDQSARPLSDIYRSGRSWTALRRAAGLPTPPAGPAEDTLLKRLHRLVSADDVERTNTWRRWLAAPNPPKQDGLSIREQRLAAMLFFVLLHNGGGFRSYDEGLVSLWDEEGLRAEAVELLAVAEDRISHVVRPLTGALADVPLWVHAHYSRDELLAGLGQAHLGRLPMTDRQGVRFVKHLDADVFTLTVHKSAADYSPTTMYRDYPISRELIHWESQHMTSDSSPTGRRYIEHVRRGSNVLLFGRLREQDEVGTASFMFLGPATYVRHEGSSPMAITWRLSHPLPVDWFTEAGVLAG